MAASCRIPHCPIAKNGTCLEGIEQVSKCPNYVAAGAVESPSSAVQGSATPPVPKVETVSLPVAVAMTPEGTYEITRASFARVVICAGEQRSGKTTLLASLYEAFQSGAVGSLSFAGSRTLHGYERRVHLSRCASGLERADTDRTKPREGFQFLHLRLRDSRTEQRTDLLFGDMSGELYKTLRDSTAECRKYAFLGAGHEFLVLLDGRKIEQGEHAEAFGHVSALVRSLLDAQVLGGNSRVRLLTTKWDLLEAPERSAERTRVSDFENHFRQTYGARLAALSCSHSAARPDNGDPQGIEPLLQSWVAMPELVTVTAIPKSTVSPTRAFDIYSSVRHAQSPWSATW